MNADQLIEQAGDLAHKMFPGVNEIQSRHKYYAVLLEQKVREVVKAHNDKA